MMSAPANITNVGTSPLASRWRIALTTLQQQRLRATTHRAHLWRRRGRKYHPPLLLLLARNKLLLYITSAACYYVPPPRLRSSAAAAASRHQQHAARRAAPSAAARRTQFMASSDTYGASPRRLESITTLHAHAPHARLLVACGRTHYYAAAASSCVVEDHELPCQTTT